MTLTFDLLTSKSNQFTVVPNCTQVENLVKFPQVVCEISRSLTFSSVATTDQEILSILQHWSSRSIASQTSHHTIYGT